ncbi:MAG: CxxC-x17-CxxC domain-containing protein [bacterium]
MGNFKRRDSFGGKKRFGDDRGERSERPSMHQAICADCGDKCEVPFRPSGDKPVFCSNCFGKKESSGGGRFERRPSGRQSFGDKKMFQTVCDKCHKECEVPFRPSGDKPVFCSDCFGKKESSSGDKVVGSDQHKKQFEMLNGKLDDILKILSHKVSIKKEKHVVKAVKKKSIAHKKAVKKVVVKKKKK